MFSAEEKNAQAWGRISKGSPSAESVVAGTCELASGTADYMSVFDNSRYGESIDEVHQCKHGGVRPLENLLAAFLLLSDFRRVHKASATRDAGAMRDAWSHAYLPDRNATAVKTVLQNRVLGVAVVSTLGFRDHRTRADPRERAGAWLARSRWSMRSTARLASIMRAPFTPKASTWARLLLPQTLSVFLKQPYHQRNRPDHARFSDFTGIPDIPTRQAAPIPVASAPFKLAGDASMDIVSHSFNGFPTAITNEFATVAAIAIK